MFWAKFHVLTGLRWQMFWDTFTPKVRHMAIWVYLGVPEVISQNSGIWEMESYLEITLSIHQLSNCESWSPLEFALVVGGQKLIKLWVSNLVSDRGNTTWACFVYSTLMYNCVMNEFCWNVFLVWKSLTYFDPLILQKWEWLGLCSSVN